MTSVDSARRARAYTGLSLREVSALGAIAAPNLSAIESGRRAPTTTTSDRIARSLGMKVVWAPIQGRSSVAEISNYMAEAISRDDGRSTYRYFIQMADDLASASPINRAVLAVEPPTRTSPEWDAAIAALTEWRLEQVNIPAPEWAARVKGDAEWNWSPPSNLLTGRPEFVPEQFRRRGVLIEEGELASV